jgi:hypothetical protein
VGITSLTLFRHGNVDMDDNDKIPDEEKDLDEQVVNDNVQETTTRGPNTA